MVSKDFKKLIELVFDQKYKIYSSEINIPGGLELSSTISFILKKDNKEIKFESKEEDVLIYVSSLNLTVDKEGNMELMSYKDLNKLYDDIDFLIDKDKKKLSLAIQKRESEKFKFSYDPDKLFKEFLLSERRTSKKFEKLKTDYFEISAYFIFISKGLLGAKEKMILKYPRSENYCELIDEILKNAFRKDPNPIKNYLKYSKYIVLDLNYLIKQANNGSKYIENLFKTLAKKKISADFGIY